MNEAILVLVGALWLASITLAAFVSHVMTSRALLSRPLIRAAIGLEPVVQQLGGIHELSSKARMLWDRRHHAGGRSVPATDAEQSPPKRRPARPAQIGGEVSFTAPRQGPEGFTYSTAGSGIGRKEVTERHRPEDGQGEWSIAPRQEERS